jgi:hypothetical protein
MKKIICCCLLIILVTKLQAQNVTITPEGITPAYTHPRISYDAILALPSPQEGNLAYDTTFHCLRIYTQGKWLCSYQNPESYTPNLTPIVSQGGTGDDSAGGIAVDASGNIYIAGSYSGTVTFGSTTLNAVGSTDIFIAKYNKAGILQWVQSAGGTGSDAGMDIAVNASGGIYITGSFSGTATFGVTSINSAGNSDIFVAKYSADGLNQWVQKAGSVGNDSGISIAVDGSGNSYITGNFTNTVTFGTASVTAQSSGADAFVAKCNNSGTFEWAQSGGGGGYDSGAGIGVDGSGNVYITGGYSGTGTFGTTQLTFNGIGDNIFLAKYNSEGIFQWIRTAGAFYYEIGRDLAVDAEGNTYITGSFADTITFGEISITSKSGALDLFIAKHDSNGNVIWAKPAGGSEIEVGTGIAIDGSGVYVTGHYSSYVTLGSKTISPSGGNNDIWLIKFNKSNGSFVWVQTAGGTESDKGTGIAVDNTGNLYAVGEYTGTAQFGKTTKTSQGNSDIFVIRIDK